MEYEKYLYDTEQMKADVRTYIALGMNWIRYHSSLAKDNNEKKKDKITNIVNEDILKAWDKIDYFEKATGKDIFSAIRELDEKEKQFVINAKELRIKTNQNNAIDKKIKSDLDYMRLLIDKIKRTDNEYINAIDKTEKDKLKDETMQRYIRLGHMFMFHRLEPYIDQFTPEEQQYINEGRMAELGSEYAEEAEKARKFLKTSAAFKKVGDRITQVGVDFNKTMTSKGEELGDKVRQAGVKLSPVFISWGEGTINFADILEDKANTALDKLEDKTDDIFAKIQWKGIKKHIKKECLKIVPNAPDEAIEIKAKNMFFEGRDYILNEYPVLKQKVEELRKKYMQEKGPNINEKDFETYLSTQIHDYDKFSNFTNNYIFFYNILVKHDYEYVNS